MRLIDADALDTKLQTLANRYAEQGRIEVAQDYNFVATVIGAAPTIDAVPVEMVAQMFHDAFGDECPCNYNGIDEWLPMVCGDGNWCGEHDDPLYCWKQFIKHYRERKEGAE